MILILEYRPNDDEWLEQLQEDDLVQISGKDLLALLRKDGAPKGRKPISVDTDLFNAVVTRWKNGEITARQAMQTLNLKPNTFYRRMKEYTDMDMKEIKEEVIEAAKAGKEELKVLKEKLHAEAQDVKADMKDLREKLHSGAAETKEDIQVLRKHVKAGAAELKTAVSEKKELHDMEREIRMEKYGAQLQHAKEMEELRAEVSAETASFKSEQ